MPRKYELRRRAERQHATRQRIVEATVGLHQELGLARTTISEIAARAGVERATVYRHFPDEESLFTACTSHYFANHPLPNPASWQATPNSAERLVRALTDIYTYHRQTEPMISRTTPDLPQVPYAQEVLTPVHEYWAKVRELLAAGWVADPVRQRHIMALVGHAISFSTWSSLVRDQGLDEAEAVVAMVGLVRCAADQTPA